MRRPPIPIFGTLRSLSAGSWVVCYKNCASTRRGDRKNLGECCRSAESFTATGARNALCHPTRQRCMAFWADKPLFGAVADEFLAFVAGARSACGMVAMTHPAAQGPALHQRRLASQDRQGETSSRRSRHARFDAASRPRSTHRRTVPMSSSTPAQGCPCCPFQYWKA